MYFVSVDSDYFQVYSNQGSQYDVVPMRPRIDTTSYFWKRSYIILTRIRIGRIGRLHTTWSYFGPVIPPIVASWNRFKESENNDDHKNEIHISIVEGPWCFDLLNINCISLFNESMTLFEAVHSAVSRHILEVIFLRF